MEFLLSVEPNEPIIKTQIQETERDRDRDEKTKSKPEISKIQTTIGKQQQQLIKPTKILVTLAKRCDY